MRNFEWESQRWESQLPAGARHVRVSVRQALANCFGSPAAIAVDPAAEGGRMQPFDRYWWDIACTYVEHVQNGFGAWQVQERRQPLKIVYFAHWRKDEDAQYHQRRG